MEPKIAPKALLSERILSVVSAPRYLAASAVLLVSLLIFFTYFGDPTLRLPVFLGCGVLLIIVGMWLIDRTSLSIGKGRTWLTIPGLCGLLLLLVLFVVWRGMVEDDRQLAEQREIADAHSAESLVKARVAEIKQALFGLSGLFSTSDLVTGIQWKSYVNNMVKEGGLSSVEAIGYVDQVHRDDLEGFAEYARSLLGFDFEIEDSGFEPWLHIVRYVGGGVDNSSLAGKNLALDSTWSAAAKLSIETGRLVTSAGFPTEQEGGAEFFYTLLPVYDQLGVVDGESSTVDGRSEHTRGFVFAQVALKRLLSLEDHPLGAHMVAVPRHHLTPSPSDGENSGFSLGDVLVNSDLMIEWVNTRAKSDPPRLEGEVVVGMGMLCVLGTVFLFYALESRFSTASRSLLTERRRFELVINAAQDGIWEYRVADGVSYLSNRLLGMLDVQVAPDTSAVDLLCSRVVAEDESMLRGLLQRCEEIDVPQSAELRFVDDAGAEKWFALVSIGSISDGVHSLTGSLIDIDDRKRAEHQRELLVETLTDKNTELERFAYVTSHDLQEPLRMVVNFGEMLADEYADKLDEQGQHWLQIMSKSATHMSQLINDALDYSRLDSLTDRFEVVSVHSVLEMALEDLSLMIIEAKGVVDYPGEMPHVIGTSSLLKRVFSNILSNAIKYRSPERHPEIRLSMTRGEANTVVIHVTDNGMGIAPEYLEGVFLPFKRLHHRNTISGTGLGLSICQKLLASVGGDISLNSVVGVGTTFSITLKEGMSQGDVIEASVMDEKPLQH